MVFALSLSVLTIFFSSFTFYTLTRPFLFWHHTSWRIFFWVSKLTTFPISKFILTQIILTRKVSNWNWDSWFCVTISNWQGKVARQSRYWLRKTSKNKTVEFQKKIITSGAARIFFNSRKFPKKVTLAKYRSIFFVFFSSKSDSRNIWILLVNPW